MENQNRTIGDNFPRRDRPTDSRREDTVHLMRFAEDLFSDQIVRRFPNLTDINRVDLDTVEQIARVTITLAPIFLRVWRSLEDESSLRSERSRAA